MDNLLYSIKKNKEYKKNSFTRNDFKKVIEDNLFSLLGVKLLASTFYINKDNNEYIDTLGIDENLKLVIIEYRIGKFSRVIQNGLIYIDYIKSHLSIFKMLINDNIAKLGLDKNNLKEIDYNARLVVIGEFFHKYDGDSIAKMPYNIELISFTNYNKDFISLYKTYVSRNIDMNDFNYQMNSNEKELLNALNDYILSLGEEIVINGNKNIISYRKIKTFMYVLFSNKNGFEVLIGGKVKSVNDYKDISKIEKDIENCYDKR